MKNVMLCLVVLAPILGSISGCEKKPQQGELRFSNHQIQSYHGPKWGWEDEGVLFGYQESAYFSDRLKELERKMKCLSKGGHQFKFWTSDNHQVRLGYLCEKCPEVLWKTIEDLTPEEIKALQVLGVIEKSSG